MIKTSSRGGGQWGDTTTGVIKTSTRGGGGQWGDTTTGMIKTSTRGGQWGDTTTGVIKTSSRGGRTMGRYDYGHSEQTLSARGRIMGAIVRQALV